MSRWQVFKQCQNWCYCAAPAGISQGVARLLWALSNKGEHCYSRADLSNLVWARTPHTYVQTLNVWELYCDGGWGHRGTNWKCLGSFYNKRQWLWSLWESGINERFTIIREVGLLFHSRLSFALTGKIMTPNSSWKFYLKSQSPGWPQVSSNLILNQHISINTQWWRTWTERQPLTDIMWSLCLVQRG